jgi:hypothetical protein
MSADDAKHTERSKTCRRSRGGEAVKGAIAGCTGKLSRKGVCVCVCVYGMTHITMPVGGLSYRYGVTLDPPGVAGVEGEAA